MPKFRKRPVEIEGIQWIGDNLQEVLNFVGKHKKFKAWFENFNHYKKHVAASGNIFKIFTLEGVMSATPGDWIIRGVKGECYPCKPEIFEATYEPVQEMSA